MLLTSGCRLPLPALELEANGNASGVEYCRETEEEQSIKIEFRKHLPVIDNTAQTEWPAIYEIGRFDRKTAIAQNGK